MGVRGVLSLPPLELQRSSMTLIEFIQRIVKQLTFNQLVVGSIPTAVTTLEPL